MKLGLALGYFSSAKVLGITYPPPDIGDLIGLAEDLGYDSMWTAEAWGSDALTPLAWWGARTTRLRLGTSIIQLSARTPTATAMAAMTLDHLSGGRFVLGLGVSGPQVVEGWYGQPFPKPLARTREYVEIIRKVLAREAPVTSDGPHYPLPYPGGAGLGKPLTSIIHPLRADLPIVLGAEGPKNIALAAEIADGWLPVFFAPRLDEMYQKSLAEGFARAGARRTPDDFEVIGVVPVAVDDDVERAADQLRPFIALYVGGMGARDANFHFDIVSRMGYEADAIRIRDLFLAGRRDEAVAAVPTRLVEEVALVGPPDKIKDDLALWRSSALTTMVVGGPLSATTIRTMAELVLGG